jgi:hypothetical protein
MTEEQAATIEPITRVDGRDGKVGKCWEVESLSQAGVVRLVLAALDALLPEPLDEVLEREDEQREALREYLQAWEGWRP